MNPIVLGLALVAAPKALRALGLVGEPAGGGASPGAKTASSDHWLGQHLRWHISHVDALLRQAAAAMKGNRGPDMADALGRAQEHLRAAATIVKYGLTDAAAKAAAPALGQRAKVWTQLRDAGKRHFVQQAAASAAPAARAAGPMPRAPVAPTPSSPGRPDLEVLPGGPDGEWEPQAIGEENDPGLMGLT